MGEFFFFWRIICYGVKCMLEIGKLMKNIIEKKQVDINLEEERFEGNVLDVSLDNQGIIYNLCKNNKNDIKVEYIQNDTSKFINNESYDIVTLFFTLESLGFNTHIKGLVEEVTPYLRKGGHIIIWDLEKSRWKWANLTLNILLPGKVKKTINIKNLNIFADYSGKRIKKLLEKDYDIIEFTSRDNIYYIKASRKGRTKDESSTDSDQCKIHT